MARDLRPRSPWWPIAAGAISAFLVLWVWGSAREPGAIHDERAYLLQAEIFSTGHWTGRVPPLPEWFEQMHVFVEPRLAAKYPPGHSMLLAVGVAAGIPGFVPVFLTGLAGGLVFSIARRLSDSMMTALLTWALWSTSMVNLFWRATYLSQSSSAALWLLAVWAALRWRSEHRRHHIICVAAALAWMYLTRPLSALALALPMVIWLSPDLRDPRFRASMVTAGVIMIPVLLVNLLWQERTSGDWFTSPYALYSAEYFPFDKPGFGLDSTAPTRPVPPEMAAVGAQYRAGHVSHQPANLPRIFLERALTVLLALSAGWRRPLVVFFAIGVIRSRGPTRMLLLSMLSLLGAYLVFAHPPLWTAYYVEAFPVFFVVAAAGMVWCARGLQWLDPGLRHAGALVALVLVVRLMSVDVLTARRAVDERSAFHRKAATVLATVPVTPAIVFVRYPEWQDHNRSLVTNTPDFEKADLWIVYDRGAENARLLAVSNRAAFRLYVDDWRLERLR